MARSRNIKPQLFDNEVLAELDPFARLLFIGLWCFADREGRMEDRPKRIHKEILGYDSCDCNQLLQALNDTGFIIRYSVDGVKYIQIVNFFKHQNPHYKENASVIPEYIETNFTQNTEQVSDNTETSPRQEQDVNEDRPERDDITPDSFNEIKNVTGISEEQQVPENARCSANDLDNTTINRHCNGVSDMSPEQAPDKPQSCLSLSRLIPDSLNLIPDSLNPASADEPKGSTKVEKYKPSKKDVEDIWNKYPLKQGKAKAVKKIPQLLEAYGLDQMTRAIDRYKAYVDKKRLVDFPELKFKNGDTFFNTGYEDFLDDNFDESIMDMKAPKGKGSKNLMEDLTPAREKAYLDMELEFAEDLWPELGGADESSN